MRDKKELSIKELCNLQYKDRKLIVPLCYARGKKLLFINLKYMSGLFLAGATGTGKSVFIDDLIVSLMYKNKPSSINFIMIDPKKVELGEYDGIKHLITGKSHSGKKGYDLLINIMKLLEFRIKLLATTKHRNIGGYNKDKKEKMPHIFIIVDEGSNIIKMPDSYTVFSKILEYGEIVGIHLIFATSDYLKDYANSKFLDKFNYVMTFDLSSEEQAKYIGIKDSNWLKSDGNAIIKYPNGKIYKFRVPLVRDEEINEVVLNNK